MGKRIVFKCIMMLPLAALILVGCPEPDFIINGYPELSPMIGEAGGFVVGFDGDVVLAIPPGAVTEYTWFSIHELPYSSSSNGSELNRPFIIEPSVTFLVPAKLTINPQGCLANGKTLCCDTMKVQIVVWDSEMDYSMQSGGYCIYCCDEVTPHTVSSCIGRTGIITTVGGDRLL